MKLPKSPPSSLSSFEKFPSLRDDPKKFTSFMEVVMQIGSHGEYLHWDKLRFKPLPDFVPETITREEYWLALKMNRSSTRKPLPFKPKRETEVPFSFSRPDCLLADLRHIDVKSGGIVSTDQDVIGRQDGERFLTRSIIEEPFSSSVLEGAATTRVRAQAMIEKGASPLSRDDRMVLNNYKAMRFIKQHTQDELTPEVVLECHKIITEGTLDRQNMAGKLRDTNNVFVGDDYGEIFHEPPDFEELKERLTALCEFANARNDDEAPYIHPITRAIILHFMLAYDHPFVDGNGRTARALFYWSALRSGYWMMEYISISKIIKNAPIQYGTAFLHTETDDNDVTYFLVHQLRVLKKAIIELEHYLDRQKVKYSQIEKMLSNELFNHRQKYILTEFIRKRLREITIDMHENMQRVSYLTARKDLDDLEKNGWLVKHTVGRKYFYRAGKSLESMT